jgi:UDP-N-acetylglucosamine 2-epimerase (hydrolysing)
MSLKHILFLTGTRADFGKMKSLMNSVENHPDFENNIFITGMHTLRRYGYTAQEVIKSGFRNVHTCMNQHSGDPMEMILASTIKGLSRYVHEVKPDLLVIHGDRVEALAGAIVGALTNTKVCHIEGGERSGTIDESIRHSVSKLSHIHLVCNQEAKNRLAQMGEPKNSIYNIGSPDIDLMISDDLPSISAVKTHYDIPFENYSVLMFHPVTTDLKNLKNNIKNVVSAVIESGKNCVVIYPNNDEGVNFILDEYQRFDELERIKMFPSIQFESFLTLLKNSQCMVGNSSAGIRETPFYGLPSINIGNRQNERHYAKSILNVSYAYSEILKAIQVACNEPRRERDSYFGTGNSTEKFIDILESGCLWNDNNQKLFNDLSLEMVTNEGEMA